MKVTRKTNKEGKSAEFYRIHFGDGGQRICFRCGLGYADEFSGDIVQVGGKWLHTKSCLDPEDGG